MEKNYVKFLSAGTFMAEETTKEIDNWDINKAVEMSKSVTERYGAKPYGFYFITRSRKEDELDSRVSKESDMYYLNGTVQTLEELKKENNPNNRILISNMECNGWDRVVTTCNPWKWTQPLRDNDVVINID
jgi:hypothetical protein